MKLTIKFGYDITYGQYEAFTNIGIEKPNFITAFGDTPEEAEEKLIKKLTDAKDKRVPNDKEIEI